MNIYRTKQINVTIPVDKVTVLEAFDLHWKSIGYKNRSEAILALMEDTTKGSEAHATKPAEIAPDLPESLTLPEFLQ